MKKEPYYPNIKELTLEKFRKFFTPEKRKEFFIYYGKKGKNDFDKALAERIEMEFPTNK